MKLYGQLVIFAFFAACASQASAQDWRPLTSTTCVGVKSTDYPTLEARKREIESAMAATERRIEDTPPRPGGTPSSSAADNAPAKQDLARLQGELIELLYKQECLRADLKPDPDGSRGEGTTVDITMFYATNRKITGQSDPAQFYNADDTRQLAFGKTVVSIPSKHKIGELELPHFWKLERNPDPAKHFVIRSIEPTDTKAALAQLESAAGQSQEKSLLLFVHGFNVQFHEAALRAAQLTHDLRFPGATMFFSWPSAGSFFGYLHDEESSELAKRIFDQLLDDVSGLDIDNVYIVAHSMGNRIVGSTLASRVAENKDVKKVKELLLAAPDINADTFHDEIAPKLNQMRSTHKTIYASSADLALAASKVVHGFRRVGETTDGVLTYPGIETVDASKAAPVVRAFGHSYVLDSISVLDDVEDLIVWQRPLAQRTLTQIGNPPNVYWRLQ